MRLIIPKAVSEQARWQETLASTQTEIEFVDPWQLTILPETPDHKMRWLNLDEFSAVVSISPAAAEVLTAALDAYWPMPPVDVRWLCNGPRTARVLQQVGLAAIFPDSDHTAEAVLALPEAKVSAGEKWLVVKGVGGRDAYKVALTASGAVVTELEVYQRELNQAKLQRIVELADQCDALWLSSEFLGDELMKQPDINWSTWHGQWWVSSARIASWAEQKALKNIVVCSGATAEALSERIIQTQQ